MKIDQVTSQAVSQVAPKKGAAPSDSVKSEKSPDSNNTVDAMRQQMTQWFAKAGISPTKLGTIEQSAVKRLSRHQQIKAQRKLQNLEKVLALSLEYCLSSTYQEALDPDWFFSFVELAENVNSPAMQDLWAKIFAVEISKPGSFSLRALQLLRTLTQQDAKLIKQASAMASVRKGNRNPKIIFGFQQAPTLLSFLGNANTRQLNLSECGLGYPDILSLMDMGILFSSEIESAENPVEQRTQWRLGTHTFHLSPLRQKQTLQYYKFTSTGSELYRLFQGHVNEGYYGALQALLSQGYEFT